MYWWPLQIFAITLAAFHTSEFVLAACYMRQELSLTSFLLSGPYCVAMACAVLEYALESVWLPLLNPQKLLYAGLVMVLTGELLRKSAMITAGRSFTHKLHLEHPTNELVRSGPYSCMRHPGYLGWMLWAVGTQVMLCNPLCIIGFAATSWVFFRRRIAVEECQLRKCFKDYDAYSRRVPTYIPGIS